MMYNMGVRKKAMTYLKGADENEKKNQRYEHYEQKNGYEEKRSQQN